VNTKLAGILLLGAVLWLSTGCHSGSDEADANPSATSEAATDPTATSDTSEVRADPTATSESGVGTAAPPVQSDPSSEADPAAAADNALQPVFNKWTGNFQAMIDRRLIRALVPWSDTYYYLDGPQQHGIAYEAVTMFEEWINKEQGSDTVQIEVVILPVQRGQLLEYLTSGRGDIALGGVNITDQLEGRVDFSDPSSKELNQLLVESASSERLSGIDDLAGREVFVPENTAYWESLEILNKDFSERGLAPIKIMPAEVHLSSEDLLELVNTGSIPYTVADDAIAAYWASALPNIRVREDIIVRANLRKGWAVRSNSPELLDQINRFLVDHRQGTLLGNVLVNRYLKDTSRLKTIHTDTTKQRYAGVYPHMQTYASQYAFDPLFVAAQGFQESQLDQSLVSHRGAVGVMQLLPETAASPEVGVSDISTAEANIHAGVRYLAWIRDTYFDDPELGELQQLALALASYNAGPARVRRLRAKATARGLDPNTWFDNVELIAAEDIGKETVDYVGNIYKYYVAFKLAEERQSAE
jgi:membrane-bound lytic murein transglycosylase MltF